MSLEGAELGLQSFNHQGRPGYTFQAISMVQDLEAIKT